MKASHMIDWRKTAAEIQDDYAAVCQQLDYLLAAVETIEINAEECMDFDECTEMIVLIEDYNKLLEAVARVKESK